jgi:hypothetical protein
MIPSCAASSASRRSLSVSGRISARVATPSRSISGSAAVTTLAQPYAGASGPPHTTDSRFISGPGSPAARNVAYSACPMRASIPARRIVSWSHPCTCSHSGVAGAAHV